MHKRALDAVLESPVRIAEPGPAQWRRACSASMSMFPVVPDEDLLGEHGRDLGSDHPARVVGGE